MTYERKLTLIQDRIMPVLAIPAVAGLAVALVCLAGALWTGDSRAWLPLGWGGLLVSILSSLTGKALCHLSDRYLAQWKADLEREKRLIQALIAAKAKAEREG